MLSKTIRREFLQFFKHQGHALIPSSSVVPHEDPSLLFINAGMNQFKDVFLGKSVREYKRATTSQKCIRVGGKHNDLDNVGHTTRHLTFFEMLGNFSFGDYFKEDAIRFAWEISTQVFDFPKDKIWITVFREDDEAFALWEKIVPSSRIVRMGEKDNFWAMGDTGPCGPCSELLFDRGSLYGSATSPLEDTSGERFFEFWNLVFMQYNRDAQGTMSLLPKQSIDTGAGLERVLSLKEGVRTVFETDIFRSLIAQVETISQKTYDKSDTKLAPAFHVIADHIRSLAFAIADGAQPSNVDRGYVLRKILRRAVRYGRTLGMQEPFLAHMLPCLSSIMGDDYPELLSSQDRIAEILTLEEEAFLRTLKRGGSLLGQVVEKAEKSPLKQIEGEDAFKLKDTYGLPLEEILLIAKDTGLAVNIEAYQILEELAKEKSRSAEQKVAHTQETSLFEIFSQSHAPSIFTGYTQTTSEATLLGIIRSGVFVDTLQEGEEGTLLLSQTPFYAEKGGQVGDTGHIAHHHACFHVQNCTAPFPGIIAHSGIQEKGCLLRGEAVHAHIDVARRHKIANNHTATHLLHAALQEVLGTHIRQAGSLVEPSRLRFDFSHHKAITQEELEQIEHFVNAKIRQNLPISSYEISYEEAQQRKEIKQFFGDKYGATVRVIDMECSRELCGGTHTPYAGTIGFCKILKEGSIAAGVRRIEAVCGEEAELACLEQATLLDTCCQKLKATPATLLDKIGALLQENKEQATVIKNLKRAEIQTLAQTLLTTQTLIKGSLFLATTVAIALEDLPLLSEDLAQKCKEPFVFVLGAKKGDRCQLLVKISAEMQKKGLHAGELIKKLSPHIQGSGGGKADSAQAGGKAIEGLPLVFAEARNIVEALC